MYEIEFTSKCHKYFQKLSHEIQKRILKKINQIELGLKDRHLKYGADYFVEEVGQYRICYKSFDDKKIRIIYFVGDHKDYDRWRKGLL